MDVLNIVEAFPPNLPSEIILEVFAFAAGSDIPTALSLALVSSSIRHFTAPYLYSMVMLRTARQVEKFSEVLDKYEEFENGEVLKRNMKLKMTAGNEEDKDLVGEERIYTITPSLYVQHICVTHHAPSRTTPNSNDDPYAKIFTRCRNIYRAALQSTFLHSTLLVGEGHAVHKVRCRELMIVGPMFPSDWEEHASVLGVMYTGGAHLIDGLQTQLEPHINLPFLLEPYRPERSILENVTHLRLIESLSSPLLSGSHLSRLPHLTHLALLLREPPVHLQHNPFVDLESILRDGDGLKMVVVSFDYRGYRGYTEEVSENGRGEGLKYHYRTANASTIFLSSSNSSSRNRMINDSTTTPNNTSATSTPTTSMTNRLYTLTIDELSDMARSIDERLYVVEREEPFGRWVGGASGGENIWEFAEREEERRVQRRMRSSCDEEFVVDRGVDDRDNTSALDWKGKGKGKAFEFPTAANQRDGNISF